MHCYGLAGYDHREERLQLSTMAKSRTLPHSLVARAKVVLRSAEGETNTQIAERLNDLPGYSNDLFATHQLTVTINPTSVTVSKDGLSSTYPH